MMKSRSLRSGSAATVVIFGYFFWFVNWIVRDIKGLCLFCLFVSFAIVRAILTVPWLLAFKAVASKVDAEQFVISQTLINFPFGSVST